METTNNMQGISKKNKVPVFGIISASYQYLTSHWRQFLHLGAFPAIVVVVLWTLNDWRDMIETDPDTRIAYNLSFLVFAWFGLQWHRLLLVNETLYADWKRTSYFIAGAGVFFLIWGLLLISLPTLIVSAMFPSYQEAVSGGPPPELIGASVLFGLIFLIPVSTLMLRFVTVFPAIALGKSANIAIAWKLTRGNGIRITMIMIIVSVMMVLAILLVDILIAGLFSILPDTGRTTEILAFAAYNLVIAILFFSLVAVTAGASAKLYIDLGGMKEETGAE